MQSTQFTNLRGFIISHIQRTTNPHGFRQVGEQFIAIKNLTQPGRRVIINGRIIEEQPTAIPVTLTVELHGTGELTSSDGRRDLFELISYMVEVQGEQRGISCNVFYDDHLEFNRHLKYIFGL